MANSLWMFAGFGARLFLQAGYFVLIARSLGAYQYGAFVGATAVVSIVAPFASLGFGNLLVEHVSRDKSAFAECWGNALVVSLLSGSFLLTVVLAFTTLWMKGTFPVALILLVCLADLFAYRAVEVAAQAFQAIGQMRYTAQLNLLPNALRLVAAAGLSWFDHRLTAAVWARFYAGTSLVSVALALSLVHSRLGKPRFSLGKIRKDLSDGFYFSLGLSSQTVYNDIDKVMLARMATPADTGIYAAAYRLVEVSFTPVRAVLSATYPDFFRSGRQGLGESLSLAKRLLPGAIAYSLGIGFVLFIGAPAVTHAIGNEFARTIEALRWLCLLPLFKTIHFFVADALTGAGFQRVRSIVQVVVAIANVILNMILIPAHSWRGAAWASLVSDGLLALALSATAFIICRRPHTLQYATPKESHV